jgi:hypothetical protein
VTVRLSPAQLRELQSAIAHAAVDRLLAETLAESANSLTENENDSAQKKRGPATKGPASQIEVKPA